MKKPKVTQTIIKARKEVQKGMAMVASEATNKQMLFSIIALMLIDFPNRRMLVSMLTHKPNTSLPTRFDAPIQDRSQEHSGWFVF